MKRIAGAGRAEGASTRIRGVVWSVVGGALLLASCGRTELDPDEPKLPSSCEAPRLLCSTDCADVRHDPRHCGSCDLACQEGQLCDEGECVEHCPQGQLSCRGSSEETAAAFVCVDPASDARHCGFCEHACPANGTCSRGGCVCDGLPCGFEPPLQESCAAPLATCFTPQGQKECIDLQTSRDHCGACDVECKVGSECFEGQCEVCEPYVFHVPVAYETGPQVYRSNRAPLVADLNSDGHVDVLVASTAGSSLTVHLGDGAGSLAEPERIETLPSPVATAVADVDLDGFPEVVVAGAGGLMIHRGEQGGFDSARLAIQQGATWVDRDLLALYVGNIAGDEYPEIVVLAAHAGGAELWVIPGVLQPSQRIPTLLHSSASAMSRLQVTDLNADGSLDIAVWGATGDVLWGSPSGAWTPEPGFIALPSRKETPLRFADLNGDGRPDMLSAEAVGQGTLFYGYYLRTRLWTGASFELLAYDDAPFTSSEDIQLELGDWSDDGVTDLWLREEQTSSLAAYEGRGDGSFRRGESSNIPAGGGGIATGDLDEDGVPDLAALHRSVAALTTHHGLAEGAFESYALQLPEATYLRGARVHFYSDVTTPLVMVIGGLDLDTGRFRVLKYDGTGALVEQQQIPLYRPESIQLQDLDGDGQPDALISMERGLYWLRYAGDGRFAEPELISGVRGPRNVVVGDADGDGEADIFVPESGSPTATLHMLSRTGKEREWAEMQKWKASYLWKVVGADFSGDGLLDLALLDQGTLTVLVGVSGSTPRLATKLTLPEDAHGLQVADLNGDGVAEILSGDWRGYTAYRLSPDGSLEELARAATPKLYDTDTFWSAVPADLNDDGFSDLVESEASGVIALWQGLGDGRFERLERHIIPSSVGAVSTEDMDQDGIRDLLLFGGYQYSGSLLLLKGAITCRDP
ncbi:MAG: hypothetical protein EOO73_12045 [Myxococcales bacterium]|nr:MAG: hypothetical protein EOO73_12045 [Myxococcales bacterium]